MSKILFLMHVPWKWIKQRPQFIAEGLSLDNQVLVISDDRVKSTNGGKKNGLKHIQYASLRFLSKLKIFQKLSFILNSIHLRWLAGKCDIIWFNYPNQIAYFNDQVLMKKQIVYDCMDDAPSFYNGSTQTLLVSLKRDFVSEQM